MAKRNKNKTAGKAEKSSVDSDKISLTKQEKKREKQKQRMKSLRAEADNAHAHNNGRKSFAEKVGTQETSIVTGSNSLRAQGIRPEPDRKKQNPAISVKRKLASHASTLLALAAGVAILFSLADFALEGNFRELRAVGGNLPANLNELDPERLKIFLGLDTLFPMLLAGGLALLVVGVQVRGNRPIVRLVLTALLVGLMADFVENSLVFNALKTLENSPFQLLATTIKFGALAFAGLLAAALLPIIGLPGRVVHILLGYVYPVMAAWSIYTVMTARPFEPSDNLIVRFGIYAMLPAILLILAFYARKISEKEDA